MQRYSITMEPPAGWQAMCERHRDFFGTPDWQSVLERSFRCRTLYGWNGANGVTITVFRAGPFTVGYQGFPVGGWSGSPESLSDFLDNLRKRPEKPICIRIPVSGFDDSIECDHPVMSNPESAIIDLQRWDPASVSEKLRRAIRRAARGGLELAEGADTVSGPFLYNIYSATVRRQGGSLRYNERYFTNLVELSQSQPALRIFAALDERKLAGFVITATHGSTTYYLHGGAADEYRQRSPSDLLMGHAISTAKANGSDCFNFMASPPDQPGLVRYKEKWGAITRTQKTYTVPIQRGYPLFALAEKLYRRIR